MIEPSKGRNRPRTRRSELERLVDRAAAYLEVRTFQEAHPSARGSKPVRATNRSPRSCGSASISRISTSPSIMDTSRVWPSPSRTARVAAR
jgi:hypothetical protein